MSSYQYDFEGLWFQIYRQVVKLNRTLADDALDKNQLREVTTSIFIAQSHRGVVRPPTVNGFVQSVLRQIESINERKKQEEIFKAIKSIINNEKELKSEDL